MEQRLQVPVQENLQVPMAVFEDVSFVRLRMGRAYLHAAEDGRSLCLDPRRASHNAVWTVTPHFCATTATHCVLLRGAYGRYLGGPDVPTRGCLRQCASNCRAAAQRDLDREEILAILWRAVATGRQGVFRLRHMSGRYLRANANPSCLLPCPCRPGVSVSACRGRALDLDLCKATQWAVETVPGGGRPENPIERHSPFARVCPPLSRLCLRWLSEREIRFQLAEPSGVFSEDNWISTHHTGRSIASLKKQLVRMLAPQLIPHYTLCLRAGRYGEPTPLSIDLPRGREPLDIVLFPYYAAVSANDEFIYPDVNAVAEAAARDDVNAAGEAAARDDVNAAGEAAARDEPVL